MKRSVGAVVVLLALPAKALGAPPRVANVDEARAAHGAKSLPHVVAGGDVTVSPAEGLASITTTVTIHVVRGGPVDVGFPALFSERALNGRPFVPGTPSAGVVDAGGDLAIDVSGLPAGTYRLPLRRGARSIGTAVFRLYTPQREGSDGARAAGPFGAIGRVSVDSSNDAGDDSEPFVAVDPSNANRIVSAGNVETSRNGVGVVNVSTNGVRSPSDWTQLTFPTSFALAAKQTESEIPAGDPILAADDQGNMWAGGLSRCDPKVPTSQSHIFVNRIAFPNNRPPQFQASNAAIPVLHPGGTCPSNPAIDGVLQDKPQLTIDNWPSSPTRGRLYLTWDDPDPSGGTNVVMSYCDTRPSVTACDVGSGWSPPAVISDQVGGGSYISSDPAVGPDGTLYVVWWDYSAANAIRIDTCQAAKALVPCLGFGTDRIVASLSNHLGSGVPFACPTMAQPGGRAAPVPSVAVDPQGRLYVAWGDLGTTGSLRCAIKADHSMTLPDANQDAFNAYVARGTYAALTADPAAPSGARGTNVIADPGDHWFPWVAMDASTGKAAVALYSTRDDPSRRTSRYYVRAVVPDVGDTRVTYGPLTSVSTTATDYSDQACGSFGNDYGDYAGLAASGGFAIPAWDQRSAGGQGDVWVASLAPHTNTLEAPADNPPLPPVTSEYLPQCAPPPPATTTTTTTTTTATTTTTPAPAVDRKPPILRVTFATRVDRRGRYLVRLAAAGEPASGGVVLRTTMRRRRTLASVRIGTSGTRPVRLVLRLKRRDFTALKRAGRLRVTVVVALTDQAGNTARRSRTLTLRPSRR